MEGIYQPPLPAVAPCSALTINLSRHLRRPMKNVEKARRRCREPPFGSDYSVNARSTQERPYNKESAMKYMLMMNHPGNGPYQIAQWPKQDLQAHIAFMIRFSKKLGESGELVAAEGLSGPEQAKIVRAGKDGKPITDGVFPESKEFLAGFWIVDVDSPERAYAIAAEASAAPGPGGVPLNMPIEVRLVPSGPPKDLL